VTTPRFLDMDEDEIFTFAFRGYTAANQPVNPANSVNRGTGTTVIGTTPETQIRFGVGNNTVNMNTAFNPPGVLTTRNLWRTIRINADGIAIQID